MWVNSVRRMCAAYILVFATANASAQRDELRAQLFAARDTVWRAWFANDTALLRRFVPSAAVEITGASQWNWNDRKGIGDGSREFVRSKGKLVGVTFAGNEILHTGGTALVRSEYQLITETAGRPDTSRGRAMELFVLQGKTWVNPYWQLIPTAAAATTREFIMPDTLGANFSIADSASKLGTLADYDALVGTWEFKYQGRRQDGTFNPAFKGHWTFEKTTDGGLIEDRWRPDDPTIPMESSLYTYRAFDPEKKNWKLIGTTSRGGAVQPGWAWGTGTNHYVVQWNGAVLSRIRYLSIDANHFLWRADRSVDGGKTWLLDSGTMEAWRIGK